MNHGIGLKNDGIVNGYCEAGVIADGAGKSGKRAGRRSCSIEVQWSGAEIVGSSRDEIHLRARVDGEARSGRGLGDIGDANPTAVENRGAGIGFRAGAEAGLDRRR